MPELIDRTDSLGKIPVPGIAHSTLLQADPVWGQLAGEIAKLQTLVIELKTQHNALAVAASQASLVCVSPVPNI